MQIQYYTAAASSPARPDLRVVCENYIPSRVTAFLSSIPHYYSVVQRTPPEIRERIIQRLAFSTSETFACVMYFEEIHKLESWSELS